MMTSFDEGIEPMHVLETQINPAQKRIDPGLQLSPALLNDTPWARLKFHARIRARRLIWNSVVTGALGVKRGTDIVVSAVAIMALSPVVILLAGLIKLEDGGPIFFWQERIGQWGRPFRFPKFRSMVVDAEGLKKALLEENDHGESITFKMKQDPRITRIGRLLRRGSLDELPQLWCVLVGQMSLVGPRPPVPQEVADYSLADRRRLDVKPGLTCIWQVKGRGDIPFPEQVVLDVEYIESQDFRLDWKLLLLTIPAVLLGRGAY
jgi:lipopolysaccharide/colanic/teichoic acid biosynthesis glycosyltransferase